MQPAAGIQRRVKELLDQVEHSSVANLVCDRHDPTLTIYRIISPDGTASELTFGQLAARSRRAAAGLKRLGVGTGDRVASLIGKGSELLVTMLATWRLGAVYVPLFTAFGPDAIELRLRRSNARVVVCDEGQRHKLGGISNATIVVSGGSQNGDLTFDELLSVDAGSADDAPCDPSRAIIEIFTSGTTGDPKGVIVPAKALAAFQGYAEFGLDLRPTDLFWNAADPGWGYGLYFGLLATLSTGTPSLLLQGGFDAEQMWQILRDHGITNFAAAPTAYRALRLAAGAAGPGLELRCASSAGEPLTREVLEWSGAALGATIHDHYGQTEASMLVNNHHHPALARPLKPGSMGCAAPGWELRILELERDKPAPIGTVGRLAVELENSAFAWFEGYAGDPARSRQKLSIDCRWYFTGDLARVDEDGDFFFTSRDDDVILMAGYRIGPGEVENVLLQHPAVAETAVIATPDELRGEVLQACVVLRNDFAATDELEQELQQWVKAHYAAHAFPRKVHWFAALPKTPSGKIQRFLLRREVIDTRCPQ
jgi:acetyl-CoA synthetase